MKSHLLLGTIKGVGEEAFVLVTLTPDLVFEHVDFFIQEDHTSAADNVRQHYSKAGIPAAEIEAWIEFARKHPV